jgi:hypothetical protein
MAKQIIASMLKTPDGTILRSYHRHDYKTYTDKITGKEYMIDGGNDYIRSSANGDEIYITIMDDEPFTVIRQFFSWGTRGKDGRQPVQYKPLMSLDTDHIQAILETQTHISENTRNMFLQELDLRGEKDE